MSIKSLVCVEQSSNVPFALFINNICNKNISLANEEQIEKAKEVIRKLTFKKFSCDSFENPSLQTHYVNVEAIALDRDQVEEITDYTCEKSVFLIIVLLFIIHVY